jgi:hypothetical protein
MPRYLPESEYRIIKFQDKNRRALSKAAFASFNASVLGLGNIAARSQPTDAIAVVFDLEGFTNFCKQIEPQLSVPFYLHSFLAWLMEQVRDEMRDKDTNGDVVLWCPLPFFVKFLGDGLLLLWDSAPMNKTHNFFAGFTPRIRRIKQRATIRRSIFGAPERLLVTPIHPINRNGSRIGDWK